MSVEGSAEWIAENEDRIQTELNAWVSLGTFEQGSCFFHPTVCPSNYPFF